MTPKGSRRGSKPGERRGGRQAGTPNKVTATLKEYAAPYTTEAIDGLVKLARNEKTPAAARVAAWREVLDRGVGKPHQGLTIDGEAPQAPAAVTFVIRQAPNSDNQT